MDYKQAVSAYFKEKGERFIREYPDFARLKEANNAGFRGWKAVKEETNNHEIYHKHLNLNTAFQTIQRKLNKGGELWQTKILKKS